MARKSKYGSKVTGGRKRTIWNNREHVYDKLKKKLGKSFAARIANAGHTKAGRSRMAKKGARSRRR